MDPRIGDVERETAGARLADSFAQGRLDHEEFNERLDAIWSARTRGDLDQVFWDLPRTPAPSAVRPAPVVGRGRSPLAPVLMIALVILVAGLKGAPLVLLLAGAWFLFLRPRRSRRVVERAGRREVRRSVRAPGW